MKKMVRIDNINKKNPPSDIKTIYTYPSFGERINKRKQSNKHRRSLYKIIVHSLLWRADK
jgi:hypothetical protein